MCSSSSSGIPLFRGSNVIDAERTTPPHAQQETIAHYKFTKTPNMQRAVAVSSNFKYYVVKNTRVRVLDAASPAKGLTSWPQEDVLDLEVAPATVGSGLLGSATQDALAMATARRVVLWAVAPAAPTAPDKVVLNPLFDLNASGVLGVRWHPKHPVLFVLRVSGVIAVHLSALRAASGTQQCLSADLDVSLRANARWCSALSVPQGVQLSALGVTCAGEQCFLCLGTAQGGAFLACSQDDTDESGSSFAMFAALQAPSSSAPVAECGVLSYAAAGGVLALVALQGGSVWRAFEVQLRVPSKPLPLHQPSQVVVLPGGSTAPPHGCNCAVLPASGAAVTVQRDGTLHIMQAAANTPVLSRLYTASVGASSIASLAAGAAQTCGEAPAAPADNKETLFLVSDDDVTRVRIPLPSAPTVAVQAVRSASPPSSPAAAGGGGGAGGGGAASAPPLPKAKPNTPKAAAVHTTVHEDGDADLPALLRSMSRLQGQVDAMPAALNGAVMRAAQVAAAAATEGTVDAFKDSSANMAQEVQATLGAALAPLQAQLQEARAANAALATELRSLKACMLTPELMQAAIKSHVEPALSAAVRSQVAAVLPKAVAAALGGHADAAKEAVRGATAHAFRNASTALHNATQRCIAEQLELQLPTAVTAAVADALKQLPAPAAAVAPLEPLPCTPVPPPSDEGLCTKLLRLAAAAEYSSSIYDTAFTMALEAAAEGVLQWLCCRLAQDGVAAGEVMGSVSPVVAVCVMQQLTQGLHANVHEDTRTLLQWLQAAAQSTADVQAAGPNVQGVAREVHTALGQRLQEAAARLQAAAAAGQAGAGDTLQAVQAAQAAL